MAGVSDVRCCKHNSTDIAGIGTPPHSAKHAVSTALTSPFSAVTNARLFRTDRWLVTGELLMRVLMKVRSGIEMKW